MGGRAGVRRPLKVDLPYLSAEIDRHGNDRLYVRRHGRRVRLRLAPGEPGFADAYSAAVRGLERPQGREGPEIATAPQGTFGWLVARYVASSEFRKLEPTSQRTRRRILEDCLVERLNPDVPDLMRDCPINALSAAHVKMLRERKEGKPGAANNRRKYLSAAFGWAVEAGHLRFNPARDVRTAKRSSSGFHTWTIDEVRQFEARHPIGTKARLALALLLFTGARRGDVVTFGRQHVKDGWLRFVPRKTRYRRDTLAEKPILPELERIITTSPTGDLAFLVTEYGRPFSAAGFGGWFRKRCDEAGLPQCTAHGLRKAGAKIVAELGATDRQLMAIYDWTTAAQATTYTAAADRKKLAGDGMKLLQAGATRARD